jgi:beta-barrel assembly-enhancing protease
VSVKSLALAVWSLQFRNIKYQTANLAHSRKVPEFEDSSRGLLFKRVEIFVRAKENASSGMSDYFFNLGRKLGRAAVPALRKSKWLWQSLAGTEEESIRAETKFGEAMAEELRRRWSEAVDARDTAQVAEIGERLSAALDDPFRTFQVEAARTGAPTALALPGGFIFVDVALLDLCERDSGELAFVIGHEMAHVVRRHTFERILRRVGVEVVSAVVSRGALGTLLRQSGVKLLQSAHSRECEFEADETGARLAVKAGYDRRGARRLLERLERLRHTPEELGEYFASHPPERARLAHLRFLWEKAD